MCYGRSPYLVLVVGATYCRDAPYKAFYLNFPSDSRESSNDPGFCQQTLKIATERRKGYGVKTIWLFKRAIEGRVCIRSW
jgi:hypothetical protein